MKIAQYGTAIAVIHGIINGLHGLAHVKIPIPLSLFQSLFVGIVIFLIPILAAILLWTKLYRIGNWLLIGSLTGSLLFGIYYHYIVISPDHFTQVSFAGWGMLFQVTALLIEIVDGLGCGVGIWALKYDYIVNKL
jgi:TctA family transporter